MDHQTNTRLNRLLENGQQQLLKNGLKGIEKESLRISPSGFISQNPHPIALGSALTHSHITTDYSEALLEFITPPFADINDTLEFLLNIHKFVYANLGDELLLSASMPCGINGDASIPIAEYGSSNIGQMKYTYRLGLSYRYGRSMQSIAGIHFNYSVPEALWPILQLLESDHRDLQDFISDVYFGLIRNFQRRGWMILYLFGASPAICKSFFKSRPELIADFDSFDQYTLYHPYATSLRMSDIGYKSKSQANLKIDYNSLEGFVNSLNQAIATPDPKYQKIGVKIDGIYRQLNANTLQIENEYYNTVRPKQICHSEEKPTLALHHRGVRYIEIRSLDLDLFNPLGIDCDTTRFIEAFLLTCLLQESPENTPQDYDVNNQNQLLVAHQGRKPGLKLRKGNQTIALQDWAHGILDSIQPVCDILDADNPKKSYSNALIKQRQLVANPDLTPSAKILHGMRQNKLSFAPYALQLSNRHKESFNSNKLEDHIAEQFKQCAKASHIKQTQIESNDKISFDEFLHRHFAQT